MSETRKPFETFAHIKLGKGFVTVAVSVDNGNAEAGVAYCHPRDGVDKSFGRFLARARRDKKSTFSFKFKRVVGLKLGEQIRIEFEKFVMNPEWQAGESFDPALRNGSRPILQAPSWAFYALNRELRKRARQTKMLNTVVDVVVDDVPASSSCHVCC